MASKIRVFVGNLPWTIGHRQLREYFAQFGPVSHAQVSFDRSTGFSNGYGFIEFDKDSVANDVIRKQNHTLGGHILEVEIGKFGESRIATNSPKDDD